jgi:hypothetical protein
VAERSGDTAFARTKRRQVKKSLRPLESDRERAALQALRDIEGAWKMRQRLECGGFSTALARTKPNRIKSNPSFAPKRRSLPFVICHSTFTSRFTHHSSPDCDCTDGATNVTISTAMEFAVPHGKTA